MTKAARPRGPCDHCGNPRARRPRGLCGKCYDTPDVRVKYSRANTSSNRRGVGAGYANRPSPERPTDAPPGSEEKVRVLCERAASEVGLWHSIDATFTTGRYTPADSPLHYLASPGPS